MATIQTLASGASQDLTFTYTIKESDIGKTDLKQTVTASSDTATIQASSPAINIEAVRKTITVTVTRSNNPSDGSAYAKGEAATFNIAVKNTGNQTLTNVVVSAVTSGATVSNGTIASLGIGATSTVTGSYTIQQSDLGKGTITITFQASASGVTTVQGSAAAFAVKKAVPSTDAEFNALSWDEIKKLANDCAANGTATYTDMLGLSKKATIGSYGTFDFQLVALNNGNKTSGGKAGFTFLSKQTVVRAPAVLMGSSATWTNCSVRSTLSTTILNAFPADLKSVIEPVSVQYITSPANGSSNNSSAATSTVSDSLWLPSWYEVSGDNIRGTEGNKFDWFVAHNANSDRAKVDGSGNVAFWWLRTPIQAPTGANCWGLVSSNGGLTWDTNNSSQSVAPAFCL